MAAFLWKPSMFPLEGGFPEWYAVKLDADTLGCRIWEVLERPQWRVYAQAYRRLEQKLQELRAP